MEPFAFHIIGDIERSTLFDDIERTAVALQLTLIGADGFYLLTILVVDVIPRLCCLDMTDALRTNSDGKQHHNGYEKLPTHKSNRQN